jgi:hypothetical protein
MQSHRSADRGASPEEFDSRGDAANSGRRANPRKLGRTARWILVATCAAPLPFFGGCGSAATWSDTPDGGVGSSGGGGSGGGSSGSNGGSSSSGGKGSSSGTGSGSGSSSGGKKTDGGTGNPDGGPIVPPPPVKCSAGGTDGPATPLDFTNNLIASPAPPGNLTPQNAPQIVVYGWDDVESQAGVQFVTTLLGSLTNPAANPNTTSNKATANLNPNACYAQDPAYKCGDGTLGSNQSLVTTLVTGNGFAMGNHTMDHLENYEAGGGWSGIPTQYKDTTNGGWLPCATGPAAGLGPGACMDQATWQAILGPNDSALKTDYGVSTITGFRGPRLEMNDLGLLALKAINYQYDQTLEEIQPAGYVDAAVNVDTGSMKGFNWIPWPYTLDNGSPGIWNQQFSGDKSWVTNFPTGFWETPVYEVYVPPSLGTTIANRMLASDNPSNCMIPAGANMMHCFLSDGELSPGDAVKEVTAFDFNTFVYDRMTPDDWLTVMQHTFLLRYYGNRVPLTYGAHPIEYTSPYDSYTLEVQANNYGYRDVIKYSTYDVRQTAMTKFIQWIQADPSFSKDTFFMSAQDLVAYMQHPFDKTGMPVPADTVASPDSNGIFTQLGWTGTGATITSSSGNAAKIVFNVPPGDASSMTAPAVVSVAAGLSAGALATVSHIDIKYTTDAPFRIRLLASDGTSVTALLAGVGGDRTARIRIKDFFPGPESTAAQVGAASLVDATYMAKVNAIAFESAATAIPSQVAGGAFNTTIEQITLHGVATSSLCTP